MECTYFIEPIQFTDTHAIFNFSIYRGGTVISTGNCIFERCPTCIFYNATRLTSDKTVIDAHGTTLDIIGNSFEDAVKKSDYHFTFCSDILLQFAILNCFKRTESIWRRF